MNMQAFPSLTRTIVITSLIVLLLAGLGWRRNADAAGLLLTADTASAFGAGFTYQGLLTDGGGAANGLYDFRFELLAEGGLVGAEHVAENVQVTNGLFSTTVTITGSGIRLCLHLGKFTICSGFGLMTRRGLKPAANNEMPLMRVVYLLR